MPDYVKNNYGFMLHYAKKNSGDKHNCWRPRCSLSTSWILMA